MDMNLVVDIGNSRAKLSVFNPAGHILTIIEDHLTPEMIDSLYRKFQGLKKAILSSTREYAPEVKCYLQRKFSVFIELDEHTPIPLTNRYQTPGTLGKDRLAAVVAANFMHPGNNILVIDAGTALTFDVVTEKSEYLGGNISPGLEMRFMALHSFTERLPLITSHEVFPVWGDSTMTAIRAGVHRGILFEVEAYIEQFKKNYTKNLVILTGGDLNFFESKVKNSFFVHSNLVSTGLNRILEYNA